MEEVVVVVEKIQQQEPGFSADVVILGATAVGKTEFAHAWCPKSTLITETKFNENYEPTTVVNFFSRNFQVGGKTIELKLMDMTGKNSFHIDKLDFPFLKKNIVFLLWNPEVSAEINLYYKNLMNRIIYREDNMAEKNQEKDSTIPILILVRTKSDKDFSEDEIKRDESNLVSLANDTGFVDIYCCATSTKNKIGFDKLDEIVCEYLKKAVAHTRLELVIEDEKEGEVFTHSRHAREADIAQYKMSFDKKDERWLLLQCASIENLGSRARNNAYNIVLNNFRENTNEGLNNEIEGYKSGIVYELLSFLDKQEIDVGSKFSSFFSSSRQKKIEKEHKVILKIARNIYDFENSKNNAEASSNANDNNANANNAKSNRPNFYFGIDDHDIPKEVKAIVCKGYDWMRCLYGSSALVVSTGKRLGREVE